MAHGRAEELTGRRRYRPMWYDQDAGRQEPAYLVLQVEVSCFIRNAGGAVGGRWGCEWRDATPADISEGELV